MYREAQCIAAQALQLVCVLAADEAGRTPGLAFCSRPLPAIRLSSSSSIGGSSKGGGCYIIANTAAPDVTTCPYPCGTLSSGSGSTASAADPATSSCCSQPWHLSMMLTIAELIALDSVSDIPATIQHLELLGTCVNLLATTDVRGALVLPAAAAVALLQPVLQLLVPAVLQLLRSTATTTGWERKYLLQSLMNLFSVVLGQGMYFVWQLYPVACPVWILLVCNWHNNLAVSNRHVKGCCCNIILSYAAGTHPAYFHRMVHDQCLISLAMQLCIEYSEACID